MLELLLLDLEHDAAEHLDEAAVAVVGEAAVAGPRLQSFDGLVVQARGSESCPSCRASRTSRRSGRRRAAGCSSSRASRRRAFSSLRSCAIISVSIFGGQLAARSRSRDADVGGDGEARRHRQAGVGHLGQAGAFAAQHVLHRAVAVGLAVAEEVHVLLRALRATRSWCASSAFATLRSLPSAFFTITLYDSILRNDFRNITQLQDEALEPLQQPQPRVAQLRIVGHHQHVVEELRDRRTGRGGLGKRLPIAVARLRPRASMTGRARSMSRAAPTRPAPSSVRMPRSGASPGRDSSRYSCTRLNSSASCWKSADSVNSGKRHEVALRDRAG